MASSQPSQSDFIREMERLHKAQAAAVEAQDQEAFDEATDALALFLRYNGDGRLAEYFTSRQTGER
jgi:hypothetical protein